MAINHYEPPDNRSGGRLGTPQLPGGTGGRGNVAPFVPAGARHFGHGKSRVHHAKGKQKKHGEKKGRKFLQGRLRSQRTVLDLPDNNHIQITPINPGDQGGGPPRRSIRKTYGTINQSAGTPFSAGPAFPPQPLGDDAWPVYLPPAETFRMGACDIYTGGVFPPTTLRTANQVIAETGVWMEGHRGKVSTTDAYTHVLICDPTIEFRDLYTGQGQGTGTADYLAIPAGQTNNYWRVAFTFQTILPGIGRKRIILADRWQAPGSFTNIP